MGASARAKSGWALPPRPPRQLLLLLLPLLLLLCARWGEAGLFGGRALAPVRGEAEESGRCLFPQLTPHPDTSFFLAFTADGVEACKDMEPVLRRLEADLGIEVRRINVNARPDLALLYEAVGGGETNALPFFYNRRTAQAISGATPYTNLRKLALSDPTHLFVDSPTAEAPPPRPRGTGWTDYLVQRLLTKAAPRP